MDGRMLDRGISAVKVGRRKNCYVAGRPLTPSELKFTLEPGLACNARHPL